MKIIGGKYKNHKLKTRENIKYKPSTMKLREALFSILENFQNKDGKYDNKLKNSLFLEPFSGSGVVGIEAFSRGAKEVTLLDIDKDNIKDIQNNLNHKFFVQYSQCFNVINTDSTKFIPEKKYNLIFIDPPYYTDDIINIINLLHKNNVILDNSIVIVEIARNHMDIARHLDKFDFLELVKHKNYSKNSLLFYTYNK
ncbi:MAG TPA: RsmD family RNA methyltransferase [Candidatus Megaira endosymbiont of Hartmannula sinica]|nr:RsmD family RNA methyltransferase [Candidatus Megaera endosymbiont of Hartmannula sinica]